MPRRLAFALAMSGSAILTGLTLAPSPSIAAELRDDIPGNWPMYNRTHDGTRYSPLKEITVDNVNKLQVAWIAQIGNINGGLMETPLVVDGVVYSIGAMNRVQALDAATGKELWHYYPHLDEVVNEIFFTGIRAAWRLGTVASTLVVWTDAALLWMPRPEKNYGRRKSCRHESAADAISLRRPSTPTTLSFSDKPAGTLLNKEKSLLWIPRLGKKYGPLRR